MLVGEAEPLLAGLGARQVELRALDLEVGVRVLQLVIQQRRQPQAQRAGGLLPVCRGPPTLSRARGSLASLPASAAGRRGLALRFSVAIQSRKERCLKLPVTSGPLHLQGLHLLQLQPRQLDLSQRAQARTLAASGLKRGVQAYLVDAIFASFVAAWIGWAVCCVIVPYAQGAYLEGGARAELER